MRKIFEKWLFVVFLAPIVFLYIAFAFSGSINQGSFGMNRTINWSGLDFTNPMYNGSAFLIAYCIYLLAYLFGILSNRKTNFVFSIIHFLLFLLNLVLVVQNPTNFLIIPLITINFIIFIFNLKKSVKIKQNLF